MTDNNSAAAGDADRSATDSATTSTTSPATAPAAETAVGDAPAAKKPLPAGLAILIAVVVGGGIAAQARINGELSARAGDGFVAASISFGSGLVILMVCLLVMRSGRAGVARVWGMLRSGTMPWWTVLGGLAGALLVLSQGLTAALVGVALFSVAVIAGQTVSGLLLDRAGFGPTGVVRITVPRAAGAILALIAVGWSVSGQLGGPVPVWVLILPLIAGLGLSWQQAVNGRVKVAAQSTLAATFGNFVVGTAALVVAMLIHSSFVGWPSSLPTEWWLYIGGAIGCVFIGTLAWLVQHTGVLVLGLASVAGQLLAAIAIDVIFPSDATHLGFATFGSTALALCAVVIASARWKRRTR